MDPLGSLHVGKRDCVRPFEQSLCRLEEKLRILQRAPRNCTYCDVRVTNEHCDVYESVWMTVPLCDSQLYGVPELSLQSWEGTKIYAGTPNHVTRHGWAGGFRGQSLRYVGC